jgi:hypothetical protein
VRAHIGAALSTNSLRIIVPPQVMIQMLVGEAGGQPYDVEQQSILVSARNRFDDGDFPPKSSTWQGVLTSPGQYDGLPNGTTNGPERELNNAARVFSGEVGDIVAGAQCYWSPTNAQWAIVQTALQSGTANMPLNTNSKCWTNATRQLVYKASIGLNVSGGANYAGAPAFVFARKRLSNAPAVVQIP